MTSEQRSSPRLIAGLLAGAAFALAGPFVVAVAGQSGNHPASELRRGAEVRWTEWDLDGERYVDYRFWVWQAGYAEVKAGASPSVGEGAGLKGEAVAARRICYPSGTCSSFSYWRGPAGDDVPGDGNSFWMDPVTGMAHFEGTLLRRDGEACSVVMDWGAAPPDYTGRQVPTPSDPNATVWRNYGSASGSVSCWPALAPSRDAKIWVSTGL